MTITGLFFSTTKANGHFVTFDLGYFLDLTVFTLLSQKGKKNFIFPPCLHSIVNMCNISASSFTYSCIKAEFVKPSTSLILPSDLMWAAAVIMWYWIFKLIPSFINFLTIQIYFWTPDRPKCSLSLNITDFLLITLGAHWLIPIQLVRWIMGMWFAFWNGIFFFLMGWNESCWCI